jgi:hypothetical protein
MLKNERGEAVLALLGTILFISGMMWGVIADNERAKGFAEGVQHCEAKSSVAITVE